jgi:hypothetical protein
LAARALPRSIAKGFQKLVANVGLGRAGIVMGLEVSRLARNCADWHRLIELCGTRNTLILDEDGVYEPTAFNDRLLLGLKGTMSEAETYLIRARLRGGILNKKISIDMVQRRPVDRPCTWIGMPVEAAARGLCGYFGVGDVGELTERLDDDITPVDFPYHSPCADAIHAAFDFSRTGLIDNEQRTLNSPGFFRDITDTARIEEFEWPDPERHIDPRACKAAVVFAHGKWFWHESDTKARGADEILDMLRTCRERKANFVLNAAPTNRGLLRECDVERLAEIGECALRNDCISDHLPDS